MESLSGLDLGFDDAQQAIADAVAGFCRDRCSDAVVRAAVDAFPAALWRELAELGVLAIATPDGEGGAQELVAAMESLGHAAYPGPLAETVFAMQMLPPSERAAVGTGASLASVGVPPLLAWALLAGVFVELDGDAAWLAEPRGAVEAVATLGGDAWGRVSLVRRTLLGDATRARALADLALAAYLAAAGKRLVLAAADHARTRRQFGRAIGTFQAVAHPLADCVIALDAAATLARVGAWEWDACATPAQLRAAAARLSAARAAERAAHTAHQTFGALGITRDGPVFPVARRILQLVATPPGPQRVRETLLSAAGL